MSDAANRHGQNTEETIFSAALRLQDGAERAAYLEEACAGREELRARVERLLRASPDLNGFMEHPHDSLTIGISKADSFPEDTPEQTRVGRYKLLQKIGEGGCGVVYMAEQEQPVRRRVALKLIKAGMDTKSVLARFEAERQALAMMEHPNIAKVLDGGTTENGRPYFVMELVRGTKITEFCDRNHLSTRERIDLFVQVCQAVQHAHQKGVIHRDLKPSNILVTVRDPGSRGVPVIIDFGIAKAMQGRLTDQTLFTAFEQFLGTPAYMSPEQAMMTSLDIDTRSDIYSLGVLLYELLTGRTPFDVKELLAAGFDEMRRTIQEKAPPLPSVRLSTLMAAEQTSAASLRQTELPKLIHLVRGDIDWIVMKCLEKDRSRRYETADALAQDLQRHLSNEPVAARPPSRWYEFQKSVKRHKAGFAAATAIMIALAAGVMASSLAAVRARRAEQQTRRIAYVADMDLANRALNEGDLGIARAQLRRYWPRSGEVDLRNWEWRYLAKQSDGDPHFSLAGHSGIVASARFLDDNTLVTGGRNDWRTVLWNLNERRPAAVITNQGIGGTVSDVMTVAPKRKAMYFRAGWRAAKAITHVDLQRGVESAKRIVTEGPPQSVDLSPDQKVLAVASGNRAQLWDLDGGYWLQSFETEAGDVTQGLFSPDGQMLVVADVSGRIAFWNVAERRKLDVVTNELGRPGFLKFSPDGRWLADPGGKSPTRIWKVEDRTLTAELSDPIFAERAIFSPDGRWLAMVGGDSSIRLWETTTWRKSRTLRGHTDPITAVDFSPDGRLLATGARDGELKLWQVDEPPNTSERVSFRKAAFFGLAGDGSGFGLIHQTVLPSGAAKWSAEGWSASPLQRTVAAELPAPPSSGVALAKARGVILGFMDGSIRIAGPDLEKELVLTNAHRGEVYRMDVSLDGSTLATKGIIEGLTPNNSIRIWRLPELEPIAELPYAEHVHSFKLSDDGKLLAGFTGPGDMGVWKIPSMEGPPMWRAYGAAQDLEACAFSPDGRLVAAATMSGELFLWELASQKRMTFPRAQTKYRSLSFSPDGSRLAAGSVGESKLFDTATGQAVLSFGFPGLMLAFARDGERLLAVHESGASVFHAPALETLQFNWLKEQPSEEPPPFLGPNPNYTRPDRGRRGQDKR